MRVLILSSSTGGGHDMRARAFQAWARQTPELNLKVQVHRPLDTGPVLYRFGVAFYNWIQFRAPWLHHGYFNFLELVRPCRSVRGLLGAKKFGEVLSDARPDVLLSVHGSLNHGYFEYARQFFRDKKIRCVTYCGELSGGYGFSRNWVNPAVDLFIGSVKETCETAARGGVAAEKIHDGGFLLRPEFYQPRMEKEARNEYVRNELGFIPGEFILLLSASSRGANNHIRFLNTLKNLGMNPQIVLLCGKSSQAQTEAAGWIAQNPGARVKILPHRTDVAKLLQSVSAVLARPGTGAASEAIISQCPLLLNCLGGVMPQEWITVKFCRKHRIAEPIYLVKDMPRLLTEWWRRPDIAAGIRERMRQICPWGNPRQILKAVIGADFKEPTNT